jgi:hypothetical protein
MARSEFATVGLPVNAIYPQKFPPIIFEESVSFMNAKKKLQKTGGLTAVAPFLSVG